MFFTIYFYNIYIVDLVADSNNGFRKKILLFMLFLTFQGL